jgi:hypothetical protein
MAIYDMNSNGFKGVVTRQCRGLPVHVYKYSNHCTVLVYRHACVLKQPDGYMLVYTGSNRDTVFVEANEWVDPSQRTLEHFMQGV